MPPISWQDFRKVCILLGCFEARQKGSHLIMKRPGMKRPVVIPRHRELKPDILASNLRTLGKTHAELEDLLGQI